MADSLDVKASILLLVITFIATQTAYFLDKHATGYAHSLLIASGVLLGLATVAAFVELWPRTYVIPAPETSGVDRAAELRDFYAKHEGIGADSMMSEFTKNEMGWAQARIEKNEGINYTKARFLGWSFYLTALAMTLNILVLFTRLF